MKFLFAPDSFKGSLSSHEVIDCLTTAAGAVFPGAEIVGIPIADGGEGTVDSFLTACPGEKVYVGVRSPEGKSVTAYYGSLNDGTAVIEMAQASGLGLANADKNPLYTTSYGTGELIAHALKRHKKIIIGIGGSATNDGGIGAMSALGVKFYDEQGALISPGRGIDLRCITRVDVSGLDPNIKNAEITVMCDVDNPLTGEHGATYTFGPQKGADAERLALLEHGMQHYADLVKRSLGVDMEHIPGAGAAGGLGGALKVFLGAELRRGIDVMLELVHFKELLRGADLVVTGEGNFDAQSLHDKAPIGIARLCKEAGVPCVVIAGGVGDGVEKAYDLGVSAVMSIVPRCMGLDEAMRDSRELFLQAADRMFRLIKIGMGIRSGDLL
ncbi:MAG: glycerate kinase [Firmicutes bacterium]|nr:glycerate kinase [Bacillota bacterium]